jgi:hypothetical protein
LDDIFVTFILFMKLNLTLLYVISFLCLTFFIHEVHDWAHAVAVRLLSGSWGPRGFDKWQFPANIPVSNGQMALATLAGPVVNLLLLYQGWRMMANEDSLAEQSIGCSLVLATLPLAMVWAALTGGGDLAVGLRMLFSSTNHINRINPRLLSICALVITLAFCLPALIRAFSLLPGGPGKVVFFPIFAIAPIFIDRLVVMHLLNRLLVGCTQAEAYYWVIGWTVVTLTGWLLTRRAMTRLVTDWFMTEDDDDDE